uniref:RRM domain-containing protein n=1 Tax=Setaria digitata TaxID=48799 RepID=A0A915PX10_9BILA
MECDAGEKYNDKETFGNSGSEIVSDPKNGSSDKDKKGKRKRNRPRTKALRRTVREKIEIALCTSDSPIQDLLETDVNCVVSAPLLPVIRLLKLDTDEYRKLSCKALISIGNLSKFFSIVGDSVDTLRLVLKGNNLDHNSTVVYVDNLPHGCPVDSLERWASTFGTIVFVHPIMEGRTNLDKDPATSAVSTSAEMFACASCTGKFFQSAFIKFVDEQSAGKFIKFHQMLRKKVASRRRKKLNLGRKQAKNRSLNSTSRTGIKKKKLQKGKRKSKKKVESGIEIQLQRTGNSIGAAGDEVTGSDQTPMDVDDPTAATTTEDGNFSRWRKRKRKPTCPVDGMLCKKFKSNTGIKDFVVAEKKVETKGAEPNGFRNSYSKKISMDIGEVEGNDEINDSEKEIHDEFKNEKKVLHLTTVVTDQLSEKTFRDVGTDIPEELISGTDGTAKKRKRVHRQKRRCGNSKSCISRPKKYFHDMQKLRALYLKLRKQQMIQLKANLKKSGVSSTVSGLTKKERKRKRGRYKLMMRASKLHEEEYQDFCYPIPEEDKLVEA